MCYPIDPFSLKSLSKWHIRRFTWTAYARIREKFAALTFNSNAIPIKEIESVSAHPEPDKDLTAVTGLQLSYVLEALRSTESLSHTDVVEVGSYRGATTRVLASATRRRVVAVDPFIGYGGAENDYQIFLQQTADLPNLKHHRCTSGEAARTWSYGSLGFVFIDALHDYVNTSFDIAVWSAKLLPGGLMALHDTDNPHFPGTRKAAFAALKRMTLWSHINDLVILQKP